MRIKFSLLYFLILISSASFAQVLQNSQINGSFQIDGQYYQTDSAIGAYAPAQDIDLMGFGNLTFTNGPFTAGVRYESYNNAIVGYDQRYNGSEIVHRYAQYNNDGLDITIGNFYEQFGNGLIFRSYQDWSLGYDNAMDGIRVVFEPTKGIRLKGAYGKQRFFYENGPGIVRGIDGEISINDFLSNYKESWSSKKLKTVLGASVVSKYQKDNDPLRKLPENVLAYALRANINYNDFFLLSEYAYKYNDPSTGNGLIYKPGNALYLVSGYSKKGIGLTVSGKWIDNMNFRSDRAAVLNDLSINFLPALPKEQTYRLATLYPYGTQSNGEFSGKAELYYRFQPKTKLGGKYGTQINLSSSMVQSIDTDSATSKEFGPKSNFLTPGDERYFRDVNFEIEKKISPNFKGSAQYIYTEYNKNVIEGKVGADYVYAHINIIEFYYKINTTHNIRTELQHLFTDQDKKNWVMALIEYSIAPHWFITAYDEYNYGNEKSKERIHYLNGNIVYAFGSNRISIGYGKLRAGLLCVGGVCRVVPASSGLTFSITSSF
ncbi:MAG TPA: DUF6029 family protein [Bacteroidia bacterium]|nr:DUF6029 family protein [Bacteroidia bacterium]HNT79097.1 DUF6029 family protein [Bacteroidia bacterium]